MKLIIAGSRDFNDYNTLKRFVEHVIEEEELEVTEVVSGAARGADLLGERWAKEKGIPVKRFPADWRKHWVKAGPIRNAEMAEYGDFLIAFYHPFSRGTLNMVSQMSSRKKPYRTFKFEKGAENAKVQ